MAGAFDPTVFDPDVFETTGVVPSLSGLLAGISTVTGNLQLTTALAGSMAGAGTITGGVEYTPGMAGALAGVGLMTGSLLAPSELAGTMPGAGILTGPLAVHHYLAGTLAWTGDIAGGLDNQSAPRHTFFAKTYQKRLVFPNRVTVESQKDDSPAYTGSATDAASFALIPKQEFHQMRLASNAEAASVAAAILGKAKLQAEGGSGVVPMNVGQEVCDYVNISDRRQGDAVAGNVGYIHRHYRVSENRDQDKWEMSFGFGGWANYRSLLNELETNTDVGQNLARLYAKDAYIENLQADQIDLTSVTQDDISDGSVYSRVRSVHLDAGTIKLDDAVQYEAGYDPSSKMPGDADLDDIPNGATYSRVKSASLSAGGLVLLDQVQIGTTYGLVSGTDISAGHIKLSTTVKDGEWYNSGGVTIDALTGVTIEGGRLIFRAVGGGYSGSIFIDGAGYLRLDPWHTTITKNLIPDSPSSRFLGTAGSQWYGIWGNNIFASSFLYTNNLNPYSGTSIALGGKISGHILPSAANTYACGDATYYWLAMWAYVVGYHALTAFDKYSDSSLIKAMTAKGDEIDLATIHPALKLTPTQEDRDKVKAFNAQLSIDKQQGKRTTEKLLDEPVEFVNAGAMQGLTIGTLKELIGRIEALEAR